MVGDPNAFKLADLDVTCAVFGSEIGELLIPGPVPRAPGGILYSGVCRGCYDFARRHEPGACGTRRRDRPLKEGYCRNC